MNASKDRMTRYLLGELSESEQATLEEEYFRDPRVFEEVTRVETALVDDYVRGQLPLTERQRFEQVYMADRGRRERVKFAEALAARLDGTRESIIDGAPERDSRSRWRTWLGAIGGPRPAVGFALASLIIAAGIWFVPDSRRSREESAEATRAEQERAREVQAEAAKPSPQVRPEAPVAPEDRTAPGVPPTSDRVVTFALVVGPGVRAPAASPPATLVIPRDAQEVRLELALTERDYARYAVTVRAIGGPEILRRADLIPAVSGPAFTLTVPAASFAPGDYMLTLRGTTRGEADDLSQTLFRVGPGN